MTDMVALRRRLHRLPEIGLRTPYAQAAVVEALTELGLPARTGLGLTSVVAVLEGSRPGPTVLLRADLDGLPVTEETGLDFASEVPGAMHACGHDAHTAMLVGAADLLCARRSSLAGQVVFAFQPGEEGAGGAAAMVSEGLLEGVDRAFALHITPSLATGQVALREGPLMASADIFTVVVRGRGGHGSLPHETIDPIPVLCAIAGQLPFVVRQTTDVWDPAVVTVGRLQAGSAPNVVPDRAELSGSVRAVSEASRAAVLTAIQTLVNGCAAAFGVEAVVEFSQPCPVTVNNPSVTETVRTAAVSLLGADAVLDLPTPVMASEDFAEILGKVPGALAFLGVGAPDLDSGPVHSGRLMVDEKALTHGAALHAAVAELLLSGGPS